jgi:hypothetical protein
LLFSNHNQDAQHSLPKLMTPFAFSKGSVCFLNRHQYSHKNWNKLILKALAAAHAMIILKKQSFQEQVKMFDWFGEKTSAYELFHTLQAQA